MTTRKFHMRAVFLTILSIVVFIAAVLFMIPSNTVFAAKSSNFLSARVTGTLNGTLQKQADGSVTFNGNVIAEAEENLSQMYLFLQGAGGAGGFQNINNIFHSGNADGAGGGGAFAVILVKFQPFPNGNGESYPIVISSGIGGTHGTVKHISWYPLEHEFIPGIQPADTKCSIEGIGSIIATAGYNADMDVNSDRTRGGTVKVNALVDDFNNYLELKVERNGCVGGSKKTAVVGEASLSFTVSMYKNRLLTTKHFVAKVGGINNGGGASPYSRGGNGAYADLVVTVASEDAPSYGAGGGSAVGGIIFGEHTEEQMDSIRSGGRGGDGFVEIWG